MEKKCLEERNILLLQLTEQETCFYDECSPDYSRRDKTDLAWCRIAQKMKEKKERKRDESSTTFFESSSSSIS
jgi:hypothetical protein